MKVSRVYKFDNNMLIVFGPDGQQIPELQGECTPELFDKLKQHIDHETKLEGFNAPFNYRRDFYQP